MKNLNKKGFTLIELLAVIVILGVIMLIAIPSVSTIIDNSRKNTFVSSAQTLISGARNMVLASTTGTPAETTGFKSGKITIGSEEKEAYAIKVSSIELEKGSKNKSAFGKYIDDYCFVVAVANGTGYDYYIQLLDDTKHGIKVGAGAEGNLSSSDMKIDTNASTTTTGYYSYNTAFPTA